MNNKLIYVEDDRVFGTVITQALTNYGFEVNFMTDLDKLQGCLTSTLPDLLVLDIEVNNKNSLDLLPSIRAQYPLLPVIVASSHTRGDEITRSYEAGANHYIKKPYDFTELIFQIRKALQQTEKPMPAIWTIGSYWVDAAKHQLHCPDKSIKNLSPKEFQVLQKLFANKGQVVTRESLLQEVWGNDSSTESLNNIITLLRKKLQQDSSIKIKTYSCIGYQFDF